MKDVKKNKLRLRFHPVDVLWLALIIALIFGLVQFSIPREVNAQRGDITIRYTIELGERFDGGARRTIQEGFHERVQVGEPIFDSLRGLHIGTIIEVYARPFVVPAPEFTTRQDNSHFINDDGEITTSMVVEPFSDAGIIRRAEVEGLEFVYIVVEAQASICDYETTIGLFPVSVGREAYVRSKYFAGVGYIINVERVSQ